MEPDEYTYLDRNGVTQTIPLDDQLTGNVEVDKNPGMCRHYAFLFNMYVMLQIFNEINAKKLLPQEVNVFAGLFNNWFFITILLISIVVQVLFVQIKVIATFLKMKPLTTEEYLITVGIGASCIIWGKYR